MAALDGSEQCESWDIGASEVHITADVVFALQQYRDWCGDEAFYENGAAQVYVETARFWADRYTLQADGTAHLLFCKGPDEYCGITSNNLFTSVLVRHNLSLAVQAAELLLRTQPDTAARLGLSAQEATQWQALRDAIVLPRRADGRYLPDDTFLRLEHVDPAALKQDDSASYHTVCFDRLQRYQVIKQADALPLMSRLPELFTAQERRAAWDDYEPLCLHDSTLSFASHALFAAQNGLQAPAEHYLQKAMLLDLRDVMSNTGKEGLHVACFGEVWSAVMLGLLGLRFADGAPTAAAHLPARWQRVETQFLYRGKRYSITADSSGTRCELIENTDRRK